MSEELSSPETAERVRAYLVEHPVASHREIAAAVGIGRSTASRAVRRLLEEERISRERLGTGDGYPSRYDQPTPDESPTPTEVTPRRRTRRGHRARRPRSGGTP